MISVLVILAQQKCTCLSAIHLVISLVQWYKTVAGYIYREITDIMCHTLFEWFSIKSPGISKYLYISFSNPIIDTKINLQWSRNHQLSTSIFLKTNWDIIKYMVQEQRMKLTDLRKIKAILVDKNRNMPNQKIFKNIWNWSR